MLLMLKWMMISGGDESKNTKVAKACQGISFADPSCLRLLQLLTVYDRRTSTMLVLLWSCQYSSHDFSESRST